MTDDLESQVESLCMVLTPLSTPSLRSATSRQITCKLTGKTAKLRMEKAGNKPVSQQPTIHLTHLEAAFERLFLFALRRQRKSPPKRASRLSGVHVAWARANTSTAKSL